MTCFWLLLSLITLNHALLVRKLTSNATITFQHQTAQFGPRPNVTGQLVVSQTEDGCLQPNVTYKNSIVLIKRGNCFFSTKVLHAQEHGALGVIIGNNKPTTEWVSMVRKNYSATYTIPAVFIQNSDYNKLIKLLEGTSAGRRRLLSQDIWIATINNIGEYTTNRSSSMTIWKFVGYLLLFIPTVWCLVTVVLVIVRTLRRCVNRQRRVRRLETIPEIPYVGTKEDNASEPSTTTPEQSGENDVVSESSEVDSEDISTSLVTSIVPPFVTSNAAAPVSETSETKLLDGAQSDGMEGNESHTKQNKLRISKIWHSFGKRNSSPVPTPHNDTCSICLEEFVRGTKICLLPCGHGYHPQCIHPWLRRQSEFCPTCRQSIFADDSGRSTNVWTFFKCCTNRSRSERRRADDSGQEMVAIPNDSDDEDDDVNDEVNEGEVENDAPMAVFPPQGGTYAELPSSALSREQKIVLQSVRRMGL